MGLLGRLAQIGSGIIKQALSSEAAPTDEELGLDSSDSMPVTNTKQPEKTPVSTGSEDIPDKAAEAKDGPPLEKKSEVSDDSSVQTTRRDGNRRSL